jgi:DUF2075 family protein
MQLFAGSSREFVDETIQNRISGRLKSAFELHYRYAPPVSEVRSWQNSLRAMCNVLQHASLLDHGILLEYQLPLTSKRLDCLISGFDERRAPHAVIVELKQWDDVKESGVVDCVTTVLGGGPREVLHPSRQVGNYRDYLADGHTAFHEEGVGLSACAWLHNLVADQAEELYAPRFAATLADAPSFSGDQADRLEAFLSARVGAGDRQEVLGRILHGRTKPAKKLLEHTAQVVRNQKVYVLLDEQQVVFNRVLSLVESGLSVPEKSVVLVRGGPGTGKSVIALRLLGELCARQRNTQHATGSRAFTGNLRKLVGARAAAQFRFFNSFKIADGDGIDVLICDEAHRLRATSADRFTPKAARTGLPQIEEILRAARVSVFLIDDLQVVRPGEVGSAGLIRSAADRVGAKLHEHELEAQFRCNGSDAFVNWVDNTLGIRRTANVLWDREDPFEFRILETPRDVERAIRERAASGATARMVAGFCWPWSDPSADGSLVRDVEVGDWSMPWNAKPEAKRRSSDVPSSDHWALDPKGLEQVGCVYTAQGFEFDYVGVIFGLDLRFDPSRGEWVGDPGRSHDGGGLKKAKQDFVALARQTYRVLLTRGMRGCYVCFVDPDTRNFVRSRLE